MTGPGAGQAPAVRIVAATPLSAADAAAALRIASQAGAADGVGPLSEHALLHLRYGGDASARDVLLYSGGELAGYGHVDRADAAGPSGEVVIAPRHRRHGLGLALVRALEEQSGGQPLRLWAHGDLPAAAALATAAGYSRMRALWRMRRSLRDPVDEPGYAAGTSVRTFRAGRDEQAWVELNAAAFAGHPEQGAWTIEDLRLREREPWFDPSGFFLAERDGLLAGFHWTKIHDDHDDAGAAGGGLTGRGRRSGGEPDPGGEASRGPGRPVGEVYVVGVHPRERGTGLGRALTLTGLRYLRDRGLDEVMLFADESNGPAIALYTSLGFAHSGTDVMFARG